MKLRCKKEYDHLNLGNAASANECTGLIQTPPESDAELEAYLSIMDFRGPEAPEENKKNIKEKKG